MSIILRPDSTHPFTLGQAPPSWYIQFADGTSHSSFEGEWADVSDLITLGGMSAYVTRKPVRYVTLKEEKSGNIVMIDPPSSEEGQSSSCHFFAIKRSRLFLGAGGIASPEHWMYTCVGFFLKGGYRVNYYLSENGPYLQVTTPTAPFLT